MVLLQFKAKKGHIATDELLGALFFVCMFIGVVIFFGSFSVASAEERINQLDTTVDEHEALLIIHGFLEQEKEGSSNYEALAAALVSGEFDDVDDRIDSYFSSSKLLNWEVIVQSESGGRLYKTSNLGTRSLGFGPVHRIPFSYLDQNNQRIDRILVVRSADSSFNAFN